MKEAGRGSKTKAVALSLAGILAFAAPSVAQRGAPADLERVRYEPTDEVIVVRDVVYATYEGRDLLLDLYLPAERGAAPIPGIVVIRGGGWRVGDKGSFATIASALARRGLAAASIEYRASGEARFPAAINDTKAAVRWMRANAAEYGIDPRALGAIGGSAGAHLAAYLATTHRMDELDGEGGNPDESNRIQAVVAMALPADFTMDLAAQSEGESNAPREFLGVSYRENPDLWALASPLSHVHAGAAPALLIHSNADSVVPIRQSVRFEEAYEKAGVAVELVTIEGAPHAFWNFTRWFDETMDRAAGFFREHPRPTTDSRVCP
ncbi:MAG: alpha/beta hydrolase fold domain-containing protein [Planctomycetota bacterium]|jgi:pectinesterase